MKPIIATILLLHSIWFGIGQIWIDAHPNACSYRSTLTRLQSCLLQDPLRLWSQQLLLLLLQPSRRLPQWCLRQVGPSEVPTRPPSPIYHYLSQLWDLLVSLLILLLRNPPISLLPHLVLSLPISLPASPVAIGNPTDPPSGFPSDEPSDAPSNFPSDEPSNSPSSIHFDKSF